MYHNAQFRACLLLLGALLFAPVTGFAQSSPEVARVEDRIRPGDVIRVQIWREETLSGDFTVSTEGVVVFPNLGPYPVTDRMPSELREQLIRDYQRYLRNPSIEITFLKRVTVLGSVRSPGMHLVDPTMTLAEVLGLAGGMTPEGATDRIELIRDGNTVQTLTERMRIGEAAVQSGDRLFVPERGWVSRNPAILGAVISAAVYLAVALVLR